MKKGILFLSMFVLCLSANGQVYLDYIGAGNHEGISVTSSSQYEDASDDNVLNASGMNVRAMEASRFLGQATMGHNTSMINALKEDLDFEAWIDAQMQVPASSMFDMTNAVWEDALALHVAAGEDPNEVFGPYQLHFNYAWWQLNMTNNDLLRQRVAFALSEIFVISMNSDLTGHVDGVSSFYDILVNNAFGNYEDMLLEISLHPAMGYYLSHLNNPKEDLANNIHPDENYAREIMQLFSIGLYELNQDGTRMKDQDGNDIPTYDNDVIKEYAQVFTGLGPGGINDNVTWTEDPYFGLSIYGADLTVPMVMYDDFHEKDAKELLNGFTIGANNPGMLDIEIAINQLATHQNVGPFLALRLIQRLVKSNPTPAYISRIAAVFNDNGSGERGDLGAVVKAILLDEEARTCAPQDAIEHGKLKEPVLKLIQYAKSLDIDVPDGRYWNNGYDMIDGFKQHPMASPTVFNFFTYDHAPVGALSENGLYAPEFKIHDTGTGVTYWNSSYRWNLWNNLWWSWHGDYGVDDAEMVTFELEDLADEPEILINYLDVLYTHGQMTDKTRKFIRDAITPITWDNWERVRTAIYLLQISPDFNIAK